MKIVSYESIDDIFFEENESVFSASFGSPLRERKNNLSHREFHYSGLILRFNADSHDFIELTLLPGAEGFLNGHKMDWNIDFFRWACVSDGEPLEDLGFIVCKNLGIAITGFHDDDPAQRAITCFKRGSWDNLLKKARPFKLN